MKGVAARILRSVALLVSSTGVAGACAVVALGFNTRSLGAHDFGVLSLIQAYVALIASLASLESWQPVIRLGLKFPSRLGTTLGSGLMMDAIAACVAGLFAVVFAVSLGGVVGIAPEYRGLAAIYSMSLFAGVAGTPKGFFRLRNEFGVLAGNQVALAVAMLLASIGLWWLEASLRVYIITFAVIAAAYNLSLLIRMLVRIRLERERIRFPSKQRKGLLYARIMLGMSIGNSVLGSLLSSRRHLMLFVVGYFFGEVAAGTYSVGAKLVAVVSKFALLLNQVIFAEVINAARKLAGDIWRNLLWKASLWGLFGAVAVSLVVGVFSDQLVMLVGGPGYSAAGLIFILLLLSECIGLAGTHFNPAIQQAYGTRPLVWYAGTSLLMFLVIAVSLSIANWFPGPAIAVVVSSIVFYALMASHVWRRFPRCGPSDGFT